MIDTSTTAGKILVMQAFEDGKVIRFKHLNTSSWDVLYSDVIPVWDWREYVYEIKPQTEEEAAKEAVIVLDLEMFPNIDSCVELFKAGAQWQKEQE